MEQYLLIYDSDCGPCSKFKRMVDWLDKFNRLSYLSLVSADERGLLDSLPRIQRHTSFHLISPEGKIQSGSRAIPDLVMLFPLGRPVAFLLRTAPGAKNMTSFVYSTLSRLHDTGACAYKSCSSHGSSLDLRFKTQRN